MSPMAPCLLVASPLLIDPNFLHTVVLLVEHDENGSMGLILNRPVPLTLEKICEESHLRYGGNADDTAWRGGPVDAQRGIILVRGGLPAEEDTVLDFTDFLSFRKDLLESLLLDPVAEFRLFLGYAGWGPGQLDMEIDQGGWAQLPLSPEWLFPKEHKGLWQRAIQTLSEEDSE